MGVPLILMLMSVALSQSTPSSVRIFLHYTFGDLVVYVLVLISLAFTSSRSSRWRESTCNELSTQADLLRLLQQSGVNIEECEIWLDKFITTALTVLSIGLILKVCFPSYGVVMAD